MIREATDNDFAALIAGDAPDGLKLPDGPIDSPEVLGMLRELARGIRPHFAPASWLIIDGSEVVGLTSLVALPAGEAIDIGYGVAATRRGRGFASAAVGAILEWARGDDRVTVVRAESGVDNPASQRVLENNGFVRVGERVDDEDGPVIRWEAAAA
jgi:RimJ/RimL family protein N-acetyltransferase